MKSVSTVTLALALALGVVATQPAIAAKRPKPAAAPAPELSVPFRKAMVEIQAAVKAANPADLQAKIAAAEPLATMPDEKYYLGVMRYELSKLTRDKAMSRRAVNDMIASGSKLIPNLPELYFSSGQSAYDAQDYADAVAKLGEADRLGFTDINRLLLMAEANFKLSRYPDGLTVLDRAITSETAAGRQAPQPWFQRGVAMALKAKLPDQVAKWSRMLVKAYPTPSNWRDALVLYRDSGRLDGQAQLDVFRLMRDTKSLAGERDFYEYAALCIERALPGEAKSVIEEGYSSGAASRSSTAIKDALSNATGRIGTDTASVASDERRARTSATGVLAANTGNAYLAYGQYDKAIEMLQLALSKGGADVDMVNTRLGIALTRAGRKADARKAFSAVTGARAPIAQFWLLSLDTTP